tara:strand:- start:2814 stop:3473 length:660 start_codon:yes stop_codon:yes gene_type:complete
MSRRHELGPKQELLIVKMYNYERGEDNRFSASDCNEAALRGKNIQPLVERIEDTHLYRLTRQGVEYARNLVANGSKDNPCDPNGEGRLSFVYKIKQSGHWRMTVRVQVDNKSEHVQKLDADNGHPMEPLVDEKPESHRYDAVHFVMSFGTQQELEAKARGGCEESRDKLRMSRFWNETRSEMLRNRSNKRRPMPRDEYRKLFAEIMDRKIAEHNNSKDN